MCLVDNDASFLVLSCVLSRSLQTFLIEIVFLGLEQIGADLKWMKLIINYLFDVYSLDNHFHPLNAHATPVPNRQSHRDTVYRFPTIVLNIFCFSFKTT